MIYANLKDLFNIYSLKLSLRDVFRFLI